MKKPFFVILLLLCFPLAVLSGVYVLMKWRTDHEC